jgi:hypothetical protein
MARLAVFRIVVSGCATMLAVAPVASVAAAQELSANVGFAESGRLDETASPVRFAGHGIDLQLDYRYSPAPRTHAAPPTLLVSLDGGARSLLPLDAADGASERLTDAALRVTALRGVGGHSAFLRGLSAGVQFSAGASLNEHSYGAVASPLEASPVIQRSDFFLAAATLGPAALWERDVAGGRFSANLALPLVAMVDHPYQDVRVQRAPVDLRFVSAATYRGVDGGLSYTRPITHTLGVVYSYRIDAVNFDDDQPVRAVKQTLSIGLRYRPPPASRRRQTDK